MKVRNVSVLIIRDQGKILLQKRSLESARFPGTWGLFGGGIHPGETPLEALKREIHEELDLLIDEPSFVRKYDYVLDENNEKGEIFVYEYKHCGRGYSLQEGERLDWLLPNDALNLEMHSIFKEIIRDHGHNRISMLL